MTVDLLKIVDRGETNYIEFKAKPAEMVGKTICAFANSNCGTIYLAKDAIAKVREMARICDPAVHVSFEKILLDGTKRHVVMIKVSESEHKVHQFKGVFYQRIEDRTVSMSAAEIFSKQDSAFDSKWCYDFDYERDFDKLKLLSFLDKTEFSGNKADPIGLLENLGVAKKDNGKVIFRNAGVLFFADDLSLFYHHAAIRCARFRGVGKERPSSTKMFNRDLLSSVEGAMIFLEDHLKLEYRFPPDFRTFFA